MLSKKRILSAMVAAGRSFISPLSSFFLFADGSRAEPPIAPCEVQGYVYDAWLRTAEVAERLWGDRVLAGELREKAGELRERFNQDFWIEDRGCYVLALDKSGRKVDSLTSNMGQLLWSGIVPDERVGVIVRHLFDPDTLFSGWGVRTMAKADRGYNPIEYHNGTVWPHDNSLIAYGLYRYGYREEANRIASALLEAAACFGYTLPEVFAGYDRSETHFPVEYPTASRPQTWASGTIPLLVRAVLGLEPDPESKKLTVDPVLLEGMTGLRLTNISAFGKSFDVEAEGGEARVSVSG
jgi:glycogen debranching enzyme